jgi:hypothetical protein
LLGFRLDDETEDLNLTLDTAPAPASTTRALLGRRRLGNIALQVRDHAPHCLALELEAADALLQFGDLSLLGADRRA